ncbi:MAG TPA: hypothetical protein VF158_10775 [Longimicrobiales bacterium]
MSPRWKLAARLALAPVLGALFAAGVFIVAAVVIGGPVGMLIWLAGETALEWVALVVMVGAPVCVVLYLGYQIAQDVVR